MLLQRHLGNIRPGVGGSHAPPLVLFHDGDGALDPPGVDVVARRGFLPRVGKAGGDIARHDGADCDAEGAYFVLQRQNIGVDGGLADGVPELEGDGQDARDGAHADDAAAALLAHGGEHGLGGVVHTVEIQLQLGVGVLGLGGLRRTGDAEARVIHQNVDPPLPLQNLLHSGPDLGFVGHIGGNVPHAHLGLFPAGEFINLAACPVQLCSRAAPDAAAAAGDDCNLCHGETSCVFYKIRLYSTAGMYLRQPKKLKES